jgi:hypothetical protein
MTKQLIQFCPSLQLLQSFFQNIALKGCVTQKWMSVTVSILQKNTLTKCRPWATKNVKFSLWSVIETFPRGGARLFRGAKILSGGAKRSQGGAHLPSKSGHVTSHNFGHHVWDLTTNPHYALIIVHARSPQRYILHSPSCVSLQEVKVKQLNLKMSSLINASDYRDLTMIELFHLFHLMGNLSWCRTV